jgi:lysyl-tRNA synthetase class 1
MFWADKIASEIIESGKFTPYWVDDMKTPSGYAHVGSLMGPVLHSMIFRALKDRGKEVSFTFVINDFDPADDLLPEIKGKFESELGKPLRQAKSPNPEFESMADLFGADFINTIKDLGVEAEILSSWDMYHAGKFDEVIRLALDNAEKIQEIYHEISGSQKREKGWLPFQVICENCGKLGTTRVHDWDGETVAYTCEPELVKWATGCGHAGRISPYGGTGKLPWKVDWAAHWKVIGVTIEGAGKDHASRGGSYDIAMEICKEVFDYPDPFKMPYEFVLIGGRKMSSSKGIGLKAHDLTEIMPPAIGRFLYARNGIKSQTNFDPQDSNAIPNLFDDYRKAYEEWKKDPKSDNGRMFELSQAGEITVPPDARFSVLVQYVKELNKTEEIKNLGAQNWVKYAKVWIERFAPEEQRFEVQEEMPAVELTEKQKELLRKTISVLDTKSSEELQTEIYNFGKELGLSPAETFGSFYQIFIGKSHGPKLAALLSSMDPDFILKRLEEASK